MTPNLLWVSDFHSTGYATVAKMFINQMLKNKHFSISVLAINHIYPQLEMISKIKTEFPELDNVWSIVPSFHSNILGDEFTKKSALNQILGSQELVKISKVYQPDIIFFLNDSLCSDYLAIRWAYPSTKFVAYIPIDSTNIPPGFFELDDFDLIITMTNFANRELKRTLTKVETLYHPMNLENFHPLDNKHELRKKWLGVHHEKFTVLNVNINQGRKRLDKTIEIFDKFYQKHPNSFLVLKTQNLSNSVTDDGIDNIANYVNTKYPHLNVYIIDKVLTIVELNELYNTADVFITTTIGEGWGYTPCEAILAGVNVIVPNHTAYQEIFDLGQTCRTTPIPWLMRNMNAEKPNSGSCITYIKLVRSIHQHPIKNRIKNGIKDDLKIPSIIISEFGTDVDPSGEIGMMENIPILGNFRTLKFAKSFLKRFLPTSIIGTLHICIQFGENFSKLRNELFENAKNWQFRDNELEEMRYDLYQLSVSDLAPFMIDNHLIDITSCLGKLDILYQNWEKGKKPDDQIFNKYRKWFAKNCNIAGLTTKLEEMLKNVLVKK